MNFSENSIEIGKKPKKYTLVNTVDGKENGKVELYISCDGKKFRFRFVSKEEYYYPMHKEYNAPLYDGDIVELLISLGQKNRYLEVEVNALAANYCVIIDNKDGRGDISIEYLEKNPIKSRNKIKKSILTCDIIIATETLRALGADMDDLWFNAHSQDFDTHGRLQLYSLSPTYCESFHVTDAFLKIQFTEEDAV